MAASGAVGVDDPDAADAITSAGCVADALV
jgi:hypothetical protein